ncbi:MAG: hypothetical protein WA817_08840 [Candidatus Acidiferrum sp.]
MGSTTNAVSSVRTISPGQLKGSARGALISALFGSAWMFWAVVFSGHATPVWFSIVVLPAAVLTAWAMLRVRAVRHLAPSADELAHWVRFRKFFWIDFGIEWGLGGIGVFVLCRLGRLDLMPQALGVIIGLHFLPFVRIFRAPRYYWTGGLMVAAAPASLFIAHGYIRNIVACSAIGLTLWVTSVAALCSSSPEAFLAPPKESA